ncbi:MAG: ABC transporter ATP-binding protein [Lachnospiraceae bacterium]|nr:ABC transporter ATP-binding protein [Lachnospiraceae bacterium]
MGNSILLEMNDLTVGYSKDKPVLSGFDIRLNSHEVVGLIGLNGAGKTTFMKTLCGLMKEYRATECKWHGKPLVLRDNSFKKTRYAVFAEEHSFQYFTFREYSSYIASAYGKELTDVEPLIDGFGFREYTDICFKELSTGNLKKAYLITAFALKPELLLLDEPVNGLDFQSTEYLYRCMENYKKHGTLLFASHILESICLTSDRVLVVENGEIRKKFEKEEIDAVTIREVLGEHETV